MDKAVLEPAVWFLCFFQFPVWIVHKEGPRAADHFSLFQFSLRTSSRKQIGDCGQE